MDRVRALAQVRLVRYSNLNKSDCKESYLFQDDRFCGIRLTLGAFQAKWLIDETQVAFLRDGSLIDRAELTPESSRRAA